LVIGKERGRPTKLTSEVQARIAADLESGHSFHHACELVNIPVKTAEEWLRRGGGSDRRKASPVYAGFATAIGRSKANAQNAAMQQVRDAQSI
jgi:hypothetical protein